MAKVRRYAHLYDMLACVNVIPGCYSDSPPGQSCALLPILALMTKVGYIRFRITTQLLDYEHTCEKWPASMSRRLEDERTC